MKRKPLLLFILCAILITAACNPARKLGNGQYLLNKNTLVIDSSSVDREDLKTLYKQKPNRKILGFFRFHLWFYNLIDKEKTAQKKASWIKKTVKKNEIRRAKGKPEIDTDKLIFREKLLNIGEEPAILDSSLTERTRKQFELYLFKKGFFHSDVKDSTFYKKSHQANVSYLIHCNQPYYIHNIDYSSKDSLMNTIINGDKVNSLLHHGNRYDEDVIENERERITSELRNRGFYFFNKNYITIELDTALNTHELDIYLYVNRLNENIDQSHNLELTTENHHPYRINNVFIQGDYNPKEPNAVPPDTIFYHGYYFLKGNDPEQLRKDVILKAIFLKQGDLFTQNDLDFTYSRLLDLNVFKFIKILFTEVPRTDSLQNYLLNASIQLTPLLKQDYTIESEVTNSGGNLGLAGSVSYRNKNIFKGAELLEVKVKGGLEALRNFNDSAVSKKLLFFNTVELGPELNLTMKKFLFLPHFIEKGTSRFFNPKTNISIGLNYQSRPDFTRNIVNARFGWDFRQDAKQTWSLYLADVNSVKVSLSDAFNQKLISLNDQTLLSSYKTHITVSSRATYVYSNQTTKLLRSFFYLKVNAELSGLWLAPFVNELENYPTDAEGRRMLFRIPYSQFFKPDFDFSFHHRLNIHNVLVYRLAAGIGIEGANSSFLPFEKSFFGGGANSLRAWVARTVGPGTYKDTLNIEQSGDLKMESNIEIRSSFIKILEGAAFVDVGNIWTRKFDDARPGSQIEWNNITNQLAIAAGLGLRFDFSFFILRLDGAIKIHDPGLDLGDRWVYSKQKFQPKDVTLNLAIGYPF